VPWRPLARFRDAAVPKLDNLRRAAAAGLRVPETWWLTASEAAGVTAPPSPLAGRSVIVRSGSPTEDTQATSNAGQLLSLAVREPSAFAESLARVVAALPRDDRGAPLGAVFVQPLVKAAEAGVAFFDGFYWERTTASGGNEGLTSGLDRGEVIRGHLSRDDPWSRWLTAVHSPFRREAPRIDVEFARDTRGWILLQVRPALFPVARNETLSLANHKEILGDCPSPWIVSVLIDAGREVLSFFAAVDPEVDSWDEAYAVELAERAWMNFSFFTRLRTWDGRFRERNLTAAVGCSSLPGISGGLAVLAAKRLPDVERARVTLFIGNRNPKGEAAVRSAAAQLGKIFPAPQGPLRGLAGREIVDLPPHFGARAVHDWESPELDLFPVLLGAREVRVKVGFESRLANSSVAALARLGPRLGGALLGAFTPIARVLSRFGHSGGFVKVELWAAGGAAASAAIGGANDGQRMAALPAAFVALGIYEGSVATRGVVTAWEALGAEPLIDRLVEAGYELAGER